ncbi:YkvA family protein [Ectobacillus ponti]|uniref:YkvA family protein n=1 Tax=Ectobacillus ponti TaxID=2961894 RepID=A0AA41X8M3_9BACI|nr:YkvA family protein [Ectobacillus ponti]MCP8970732.1 YkvA family protein [Ectobacillus ponti]
MMNQLRRWAKALKSQLYILYLAYRDPRVPLHAKVFTLCVVAYACSPIDLIPDFIPVLGYLDDIILVPFGVYLALKMIPPAVLSDCRQQAERQPPARKPNSWAGAAVILAVWATGLFMAGLWLAKRL